MLNISKKEIPIFSAKEINKVEDYERFFHTKAYINKKTGKLIYYKGKSHEIIKLARRCGYKGFNKFREHRKEWHNLERQIPRSYLNEINAKLDIIKFTVEIDQEEYKKAVKIAIYPRYATVRLMAAVYTSIELPEGVSENEAIEILKDYSKKKNRSCWITIYDIKTIWVYPSGNVHTTYYKPEIRISNKFLIPSLSGRDIGKTFIY